MPAPGWPRGQQQPGNSADQAAHHNDTVTDVDQVQPQQPEHDVVVVDDDTATSIAPIVASTAPASTRSTAQLRSRGFSQLDRSRNFGCEVNHSVTSQWDTLYSTPTQNDFKLCSFNFLSINMVGGKVERCRVWDSMPGYATKDRETAIRKLLGTSLDRAIRIEVINNGPQKSNDCCFHTLRAAWTASSLEARGSSALRALLSEHEDELAIAQCNVSDIGEIVHEGAQAIQQCSVTAKQRSRQQSYDKLRHQKHSKHHNQSTLCPRRTSVRFCGLR